MGIQFSKTAYTAKKNPFWREAREVMPAGYEIAQTFSNGVVINKGAFGELLQTGDNAGKVAVIKIADVVTGGTTSAPRVSKNNYFEVGDTIMKLGKVDATPTITAIDRSNAEYDVLTLSAGITGLKATDQLQESTTYSSGNNATPLYTPNVAFESDCEITSGVVCADLCYKATIIKSMVVVNSDWFDAHSFCLKTNNGIKVINQ